MILFSRIMLTKGIWIAVGSIVVIVILTLIVSWRLFKKKHPPNPSISDEETATSKVLVFKEPGCRKMSVREIYAATNDLNALNFIGEGVAGKVYKGLLSNGCHVAIKHIKDGYGETFMREVASMSHIRHPNLVALLGFCKEEDECFLVYELSTNGNLSEWLFGKDKTLSWTQRLEIAIGSACGLWFLHTYPEGCIVHRDVKPTNILLGADFEAKLSDFGLSKVVDLGASFVSSEVRGTFGYVDPEYRQNHRVNAAGDVYSFGIVLLQLLSGKRAINMNLKKPMPLSKMCRMLTEGGALSNCADPKLEGEYSPEAFELALKLALSCLAHKQQRPKMAEVVASLEKALEISNRTMEMSAVTNAYSLTVN
ncbi:probable receptor-like protein kinase At1g30570 [Zingiber officinale]|uniref:Protein kinase domain-containing protein n=1 Tax=Zingiber officinale TaxID=94328 RepID=A0A8J5G6W0_ZINOF|nr:probable receptor-like protein kinase At1g30570 [Zingiber officinale]KAG6501720.1 hypothetical protein ZIOFF_041603 [Zingiber officinale]